MFKRTSVTFFLVAAIFYAPWWATLGLAAVAAFYFKKYYELMVLGALFDVLYGAKGGFTVGYGALGFIAAFFLFLLIERVKKELR